MQELNKAEVMDPYVKTKKIIFHIAVVVDVVSLGTIDILSPAVNVLNCGTVQELIFHVELAEIDQTNLAAPNCTYIGPSVALGKT